VTPPVISLDTQGLTDPNYVKNALIEATQKMTGGEYIKQFDILTRTVELR